MFLMASHNIWFYVKLTLKQVQIDRSGIYTIKNTKSQHKDTRQEIRNNTRHYRIFNNMVEKQDD